MARISIPASPSAIMGPLSRGAAMLKNGVLRDDVLASVIALLPCDNVEV